MCEIEILLYFMKIDPKGALFCWVIFPYFSCLAVDGREPHPRMISVWQLNKVCPIPHGQKDHKGRKDAGEELEGRILQTPRGVLKNLLPSPQI